MGGTLDVMRARILACYTDYKVENLPLQKSEENDIEKGGEGSKGGKVIGHTKSGKAIYENYDHESHKDFTSEDHVDAGLASGKNAVKHKTDSEEFKKHFSNAYKHVETSKGKSIGTTSSGKPIYEKHDHENHKEFTKQDHKDAADHHDLKSREHWGKVDDEEDGSETQEAHIKVAMHHDEQWQHHNHKSLSEGQIVARKGSISKSEENDLEKSEGSRGGKIIGHTKSGKPIYADSSHASHKEFTEAEHEEARSAHMTEEVTNRTMTERDEASAHHGRMADKVKKSEDDDLEKGRKATSFGVHSKCGKYIKTTQGWKKADIHEANGGEIEKV